MIHAERCPCAWIVALAALALTAASPVAEDTNAVARKLGQVKVREVDFQQANIHDVVEFIKDRSAGSSNGTKDDENRGVNVILRPDAVKDDGNGPLITFQARDISLLETLKIVTELAGLKCRIQGNVVIIVPKDAPDGEIIHKTYDVQSSFGQRVDEYKEELKGGVGGGR